ncbi:MAG TPA: energy transducer TonB [Bryobacteraceae bacterium]|nr:energy transducer TonB [Bryobacteraceae bacterium]
MADQVKPDISFATTAEDHLNRLFVEGVEEPWYRSFIQNIKELFDPPKLPPLQVTSKPVAVKDIWGLYGRQKKSFMMSTGFQVCVVTILFLLGTNKAVQQAAAHAVLYAIDLAPPEVKMAPQKQTQQGGGGGGDRSPLPASFGKLPKFALKQFTPPVAVYNNMAPKLAMDPTLLGDPNTPVPNIDYPLYGDPLSKYMTPSNGQGSGGGIGSGHGGGIGSGDGAGYGPGSGGGLGGGVFRVGGGVSAPVLLYKKEPEYSEEARKAKYQGTVVLYVQIDPSGKAINMKVLRSLGLGLDEKAMEAVKQWKFKPGYKDGKPVTVEATIEVNFRLL